MKMDEKILAVGNDEALLLTRAALLGTRWSVLTAGSEDMWELLQKEKFKVLVLCHSFADDEAISLVNLVRQKYPTLQILALETSVGSADHLNATATAVSTDGPLEMFQKIEVLLESKRDQVA
jgi:DNA-binding NarL/FixJ family response regulator